METLKIGIGHLIKGMQLVGFGHEEIMAVRQYLLDTKGETIGITKKFGFVDDCYSKDWDYNPCIIEEIDEKGESKYNLMIEAIQDYVKKKMTLYANEHEAESKSRYKSELILMKYNAKFEAVKEIYNYIGSHHLK